MKQPNRARASFRPAATPRPSAKLTIVPPVVPPQTASAFKDPPETLTEIFNRAATKPRRKPIASKQRIRELEKKLSRPTPTFDLTPLGRITGCYDPKRDTQLRITIKEIKQLLEDRQQINRNAFRRALKQGTLKHEFNRRSTFRR